MPRPKNRAFTGPLYAAMVRPADDGRAVWEWWCVWKDSRAAYRGERPDRTGWKRTELNVQNAFNSLVGFASRGEVTPGAQYALTIASGLAGGADVVKREDSAFAENVWEAMGCPAPTAGAAAPPPPPARSAMTPAWAAELRITLPTTRAAVTEAYRKRAAETHPDKPGGTKAAFERVKRAHETAIGWCAEREGEG